MNRETAVPKDEPISIEEALAIIRANLPEARVISYPLARVTGKYVAEDIVAPEPSPRYTNSAMDGYAVRWEDVAPAAGGSAVTLRIVGESQAGCAYAGIVGSGEAVRISTGAMMAAGCDTVIRVEDTEEAGGDLVRVKTAGRRGQDVRCEGEEFERGDLLMPRGTRLNAPRIALLASVGIDTVKAYKPCEVAVLVTGSELVSVGESIQTHQIRDANMIMLQSAIEDAGGTVRSCRRVVDEADQTRLAIAEAAADIVICTGGISVGRHDHVKEAARANGFEPLFWRIRQKPGKPLYFSRRGRTLLFGLPGNPVSAFMCFTHYVRPLIGVLSGLPFGWPIVSGEAAEDIANRGRRTNMIRVRLDWQPNGGYLITHTAKQGSHMLTSLSTTDGYIILEPGQTLSAGERIDVYRYDFLGAPRTGA